MDFQKNLIKYREQAGYKTGKDLADKLGINYTTYMAYENKQREPRYSLLIKIASLLHVSVDALLGYEPDELQKVLVELKNCGFVLSLENGKYKLSLPKHQDTFSFFFSEDELLDIHHRVMESQELKTALRNSYINNISLYGLKKLFEEVSPNQSFNVDEISKDLKLNK